MSEKSELDELAVRQQTAVERFIGGQNASKNFVRVTFATDKSTGAYPQAKQNTKIEYFEDDGDPYLDRFPKCLHEPVLLKLAKTAKWTDVLSTDLWSEGFLLNAKALSVFEAFNIGNVKRYEAEVIRGKDKVNYHYLFIANHVDSGMIDFAASEFYISDMIGTPKMLVSISSASEYQHQRELISGGKLEGISKFSRLEVKKIRNRPANHRFRAITPSGDSFLIHLLIFG